VLIAFRDRDPNGNGRQDEIGVFGMMNGYGTDTLIALINSFIYYNGTLALDATGNTVIAVPAQPAFRTALQYLNGLYREGLIDASTFTVDANTWRAVLNAQPMVVGFTAVASITNFPDPDNNPNYKALAPMLPPLTGPEGVSYVPYGAFLSSAGGYITNKARDVDLAVRFFDSFYEPDLSIRVRYGEEGVHWTRDPAILARTPSAYKELGILDRISLVVLDDIWSYPNNVIWAGVGPRYRSLEDVETVVGSPYDPNLPSSSQDALNYLMNYPAHPQYTLPVNLTYNEQDGIAVAQSFTDIGDTFLWQTIPEFVIGTRDPNSDTVWNNYLRELDNMGLQRWMSLVQAAYNRQR
jgi:putative aldouronate transport system substrate-binding protein